LRVTLTGERKGAPACHRARATPEPSPDDTLDKGDRPAEHKRALGAEGVEGRWRSVVRP
jgi:hypothetical protein